MPSFKTLTTSESRLLISNKTTKFRHLSIIPAAKPFQLQLSSSLFLPSLSLSRRTHHFPLLTFVAQTSGWAQQEEDNTVTLEEEEGVWENQDVGEPEATLSDWEPEAENEGAANEGSEGDDDFLKDREFPEPPEDAKLFVGNLPYDVDSQKLAMLFEQAGTVEIAEVSLFFALLYILQWFLLEKDCLFVHLGVVDF